MLITHLKLFLCFVFSLFLTACDNSGSSAAHLDKYSMATVALPTEKTFQVYLAETPEERRLGLSKVQSEDFNGSSGMLFVYQKTRELQFWMPETYFDLDVFFLDKNHLILDVHRGLKHHPYKATEGDVPRSKKVIGQYALEVKSGSVLAKGLKPGMRLTIKTINELR